MKNLLNFFNFIIISSSSILTIGCGESQPIQNRDYNVSLLRWQGDIITNNYDFIAKYENKITKPATDTSITEFDNLYDNNSTPRIWNNFEDLNNDLTNTVLGPQKSEVAWNALYSNVGLNASQTIQADQAQLRFYNIIAQVYQKNNVLKLVQKVDSAPLTNNVVAVTTSYGNNQRMSYGPDFVNTALINDEYEQGFWSSNQINSVSTHEYGHALSNFLGADDAGRSSFNSNWNWSTQSLLSNVSATPINNRAQALIDYLDSKENITDPNEKVLFPLIVVRSNYGRSAWSNSDPDLKDELFAEAFAEWLLTPDNFKNYNWELLNGFFLDTLPQVL